MKKFFQEFKTFIARGNVLDMAVGVVIGGAFSAIVTALVNILLSVCTWAVPGGLKGLVTVLPAVNDAQRGMDQAAEVLNAEGHVVASLGQSFEAANLQSLATVEANKLYNAKVVADNPNLIESVKSTILSKYTLHGTTYTYNLSAVIDWGTFINAIISFLIVAFVLFLIVKAFNKLHEVQDKAKNKIADKLAKPENAAAEEAKAE